MIDTLLEKYLNTIKQTLGYNDGDYEVFINPSKRDLKDAWEGDYGYRFIIDFKNKKTYVAASSVYHTTMMDKLPQLPSHDSFWKQRKHPYILTGDAEAYNHKVNSDALISGIYRYEQIGDMLEADWSFVPKSLPIDKIKKMLQDEYDMGI